jgi:BASS family bile acid:Na+ symporter
MNAKMNKFARTAEFVHRNLLVFIVLSYALAATFPTLGIWIKDARAPLGPANSLRGEISIPAILLAFLLFSAGLRVEAGRVRAIAKQPTIILAGLIANLLIPVIYLLLLMPVLGRWHNADETATILVGLALVAAMPVAGSSTGWAQHADADMALSLGLVFSSTLLSPLSAPFVLHFLQAFSPHDAAVDLSTLAGGNTSSFLILWVLVPSLSGMFVRRAISQQLAQTLQQHSRPLATVALLILCYSNASACLPQVLGQPDWDFLAVALLTVAGLCLTTFSAGFVLAYALRGDRHQRAALIFGLGMNNNGTGLVLASAALTARPLALLPIIVYNLAQHLAAGCVQMMHRKFVGTNTESSHTRKRAVTARSGLALRQPVSQAWTACRSSH